MAESVGDNRAESQEGAAPPETVVLIRQMEWTEWIPMRPDEHMPDLSMASGITAVKAGASEKLVELSVTGTGRNYEWEEEVEDDDIKDGEEPKKVKHMYGCYAYQALFAQEVPTQVAAQMRDKQAQPMAEEMARDVEREQNPASKLVIVGEHGKTMKPNIPKTKKSGKKQQPRGGRRTR